MRTEHEQDQISLGVVYFKSSLKITPMIHKTGKEQFSTFNNLVEHSGKIPILDVIEKDYNKWSL